MTQNKTLKSREQFFIDQRIYAKKCYLESCKAANDDLVIHESAINLYFDYLDKYPEYAEECYKHARESAAKYGTIRIINESRDPDHDYAARNTGIFSDTVLKYYGFFASLHYNEYDLD
jgi:hypothetical protein